MPPALKAKAGCRVRAPGAAAERLVPLCAVCQSSPGFPERCLYTISSPASPRTASPDPPCGSHPLPSLDCLRESATLLYHILVFLQCTFTGKIFYFLPYLAIFAPTDGEDLGETRLLRRGRSLQTSPGETFPSRRPPLWYERQRQRSAGGRRPGEVLFQEEVRRNKGLLPYKAICPAYQKTGQPSLVARFLMI